MEVSVDRDATAWNRRGTELVQHGDWVAAAEAFRQAIRLAPQAPENHFNLAMAFRALGQPKQAIEHFRTATQLAPDRVEYQTNLGTTLAELGHDAEALACLRTALELRPDVAMGHCNLGTMLVQTGQPAEAVDCFRAAIKLDPQHAQSHWHLGMALLMLGQYDQGWKQYEWRWKAPLFRSPRRQFPQPLWDGGPLDGRTILVHAEQGLGDAVQFARYLPSVAEAGGNLLLECDPSLIRLLEGLPHVGRCVPAGQPLPPFDLHAPMLSLPLLTGNTHPASFPAEPYLAAPPEAAERFREKVANTCGVKVGIAWAGGPHPTGRSLLPEQLAPLAGIAGVQFFSLQKGPADSQPPALSPWFDHTAELTDFADAAALIENLDLVISVDTAIAHLAGAMGKPTWLLLKFSPDWRWMLHREDTPWYPSMRLFRQQTAGDWEPVVQAVAESLKELR